MNKLGKYELVACESLARTGLYHTSHGSFETPNFMPVGTQASVKGLSPQNLEDCGAQIILSNTYHLHVRPGDKLIRDLGGLHEFMGWHGPILTDSGGFQVFSLANLRNISDKSVIFRSHIDGKQIEMSPEDVIAIQENLGSDIMMVLDECPAFSATREEVESSVNRTTLWAKRSLDARRRNDCLMFGIVQGGVFEDLRERSLREICELPFDGYAIGGVSVGEPEEYMRKITSIYAKLLPQDSIRYLMGVGTPSDIVHAVYHGIDLFDCVIPTRSARFGRIYTGKDYINIRNSQFRTDEKPLMDGCDCYCCKNFSRAYVAHLIHSGEMLGIQLASIHNVRFYERLMRDIRTAIKSNNFHSIVREYLDIA